MPLPLAPLVPLVLRLSGIVAAGFALRRALAYKVAVGRTDQRAEDVLDSLDEGVAVNRPADRAIVGDNQTNTAARMRRTIRWGNRGVEVDAALFARFRIRKV